MGTGLPFSEEDRLTQRAIEGQSGVIRDLLVEQRETNRLLRKLAGEPEDRGPAERAAEEKATQAREAAEERSAQASHTREVSEQQAAQARVQKTERWRQKAERRQEALRRRLAGSRLGLTQRRDSPRSRKRPG